MHLEMQLCPVSPLVVCALNRPQFENENKHFQQQIMSHINDQGKNSGSFVQGACLSWLLRPSGGPFQSLGLRMGWKR